MEGCSCTWRDTPGHGGILLSLEGYSWTWRDAPEQGGILLDMKGTPGHGGILLNMKECSWTWRMLLDMTSDPSIPAQSLLNSPSSVISMTSTPAPKRSRVHRFPQHEMCAALRRMFDGWDVRERIPHLENILEYDTFSAYIEKVVPCVSTSADAHLPPCTTGREQRGQVEAALGLQVDAMHSKHSLGPLAAQGDGPEAHLAPARRLASLGNLLSSQLPADDDFRFAASWAQAEKRRDSESGLHFQARLSDALSAASLRIAYPFPSHWPRCELCNRPSKNTACETCSMVICTSCAQRGIQCQCYEVETAARSHESDTYVALITVLVYVLR